MNDYGMADTRPTRTKKAFLSVSKETALFFITAIFLSLLCSLLYVLSCCEESINIYPWERDVQQTLRSDIEEVLRSFSADYTRDMVLTPEDHVRDHKLKVYNRTSLRPWMEQFAAICGGHFIGYANEFAYFEDVVVDKSFASSEKRGGESIEEVINQAEENEFVKYENGFFQLVCRDFEMSVLPAFSDSEEAEVLYQFGNKSHLIDWLKVLSITSNGMNKLKNTNDNLSNDRRVYFTVAVQRYEYANLFHTVTDWYNAFLMMVFFNRTAATTNILLVDAHPRGSLDTVWNRLFNSSFQLSSLAERTNFSRLAWSIVGYNSPMTIEVIEGRTPPLYEEFRSFFLSAYGINPATEVVRPLDCERLNVLFVWRHDYVAHPRNPEGRVSRQIWNEQTLLKAIETSHPNYRVTGEQIDKFDMDTQLRLVVDTDILVGMHGAGLTLALFLPHRRAGLIELRPLYPTSTGEHFAAIAQWRGLAFEVWNNDEVGRDFPDRGTIVPPDVVRELISNVARKLCPVENL